MHLSNDMINGLFELSGSIFLFRNCLMLFRDKQVKGVSILSTTYFFAWGVWNLFFYPSLNQWYSLLGGLSIMTANCLWILMMLYYSRGKHLLEKIDSPWPATEVKKRTYACHCDMCNHPMYEDDMAFVLDNHVVHANINCAWNVSKQNGRTYRNRAAVPLSMVPNELKLAQQK